VNATDVLLARNNQTNLLNALSLIAPSASGKAKSEETSAAASVKVDWLFELDQAKPQQRASGESGATEETDEWLQMWSS